MSSKAKLAIVAVGFICTAAVLWMAAGGHRSLPTLTYSRFLEEVRARQVASVIVIGGNSGAIRATCRLRDGKTVETVLPSDYRDALAVMQDKMVNVEIRDSSAEPLRLFMNATPFFLLLGLWIVLLMSGKFPNGPRRRIFP